MTSVLPNLFLLLLLVKALCLCLFLALKIVTALTEQRRPIPKAALFYLTGNRRGLGNLTRLKLVKRRDFKL